ncbi:MAG: bifunctional methionine sulfoxide reductase B/A protein [bacterium]
MEKENKNYRLLTEEEKRVIIDKGTEPPFTGEYYDFYEDGIYHCKRCGAPLFDSSSKFKSGSGWPSFDDCIEGSVKRLPDKDKIRTEIVCAACGAHLGHVFENEGLTEKNIRYCVNSISLSFLPRERENIKQAYFAGGCFWGVEYLFEKKKGVISAISGYMGGHLENPTYKDVCSGNSGHYEVVLLNYDANLITFEELAKYFLEIHDPTQKDGQGPDIGEQYQSVIFYNNDDEKQIAQKLIQMLRSKGYDIATKILPVTRFYKAEDYHQDYYKKHKKEPYCHFYQKRF